MNIVVDNFVFAYNEKTNEAGIVCSADAFEDDNAFYNYIELSDNTGRKLIIGDPEDEIVEVLSRLNSVMIIIADDNSSIKDIKIFDYTKVEIEG